MIKRKNGVRTVITMVVFMLVLITNCALPVFAADNISEVTILEDFVLRVDNPSEEVLEIGLEIVYYDANDDIIYTKEVSKELNAFETITIDAKDYYNSEKTQKITANIYEEKSFSAIEEGKNLMLYSVIGFVIGCEMLVGAYYSEKTDDTLNGRKMTVVLSIVGLILLGSSLTVAIWGLVALITV